MKILFITPWFPDEERPVHGVFIREHARAAAIHHEVQVIHLAGPRPVAQCFQDSEFQSTRFPLSTVRVNHLQSRVRGVSFLHLARATFAAIRRITESGFRPDVIHGNTFASANLAAAVARRIGIPFIMSEHSSIWLREGPLPTSVRLNRIGLQRARAILPVSHALGDAIIGKGRIHAPLEVLPNAVDGRVFYASERPRSATKPYRLLFVGLLESRESKGIPHLLRALRILDSPSDWHLTVVGEGRARESLEREAHELGISPQISWLGLRTREEVASLMRSMDILVHPSLQETFGCVIMEAHACGLPVVATNTGGIPEVLDQSAGRLVSPADPAALATAISLMADELPKIDHALVARQTIERFGINAIASRLSSIYSRVRETN